MQAWQTSPSLVTHHSSLLGAETARSRIATSAQEIDQPCLAAPISRIYATHVQPLPRRLL
jgi:hypothetical protein